MSRRIQILACWSKLPVAKTFPAGLRSMEITSCESAKMLRGTCQAIHTPILMSSEYTLYISTLCIPESHATIPGSWNDPSAIVRYSNAQHVILIYTWSSAPILNVNRKCTLWPVKFKVQGLLLSSLFPSDLPFATAPIPLRSQNFSVLS